jgi:hypothetical protein
VSEKDWHGEWRHNFYVGLMVIILFYVAVIGVCLTIWSAS